MIETIFYFPQNKAQYDANVGNISERTISFVPTGDGETGDIYKNGINYGCGISLSSINEVINNLPFASTTQAGIIKLGKGLKSVGDDGTVDVDFTGLNGTDGIDGLDGLVENILKTIIDKNGTGVVVTPKSLSGSTIAIADIKVGDTTQTIYAPTGEGKDYAITDFGKSGTSLTISQNNNTAKSVDIKDVVKSSIQNLIDNGDTIVSNFGQKTQVLVNPTLTSGTQIATITVDGTSETLYAPTGSGSGGSYDGPTEEEIDEKIDQAKQDLQEEIDATKDIANEEKQRLTDLINTLDSEIQTKFESMLADVDWMQENWPDGSGSTSNFGLQDVEEYLQMIGVWDENEDHTKSNAKWSKITQRVDTIELAVNALSSDGNITEALQSSINQAVQDGVASLNLDTTYAKKDDTGKIIEWLTSGFRSATSSTMTYNDILSAANNGDHSAISNLYSKVEEIDGSYIASSGVESMVDDAITGLVNNTNGKYSESQLYSAIGENAENIASVRTYVDEQTSKASIVAAVGDAEGGLVTKATYDSAMTELLSNYNGIQSLVYTYVNDNISEAGLVASSDLDDYVKKASVIASINDSGESNVKINADKINIAGITIQGSQISDIDTIISNKVTTDYINSKLGTITIDADDINLSGQTTFLNAIGDSITVKKLSAGSGSDIVSADSSGITIGHSGNFDIDGSGSVANGNISWNENGAVTFKSDVYVKSLLNDYVTIVGGLYGGIKLGEASAIAFENSATSSPYAGKFVNLNKLGLFFTDTLETAVSGADYYYLGYSFKIGEGNYYISARAGYPTNESVVTLTNGTSTCTIDSADGVTQTSDIRKKTIIADKVVSIENIADAPLFQYKPVNYTGDNIYVGSSAQYWQEIVPEAIKQGDDGYLSMNYSTINTVSSITAAKEIVKLKTENEELKSRLDAIEARLQALENA